MNVESKVEMSGEGEHNDPADILSEEPSFEEHKRCMERREDDYKERYLDDIMQRDANSRNRLDFAASHDLSPERQEEILNAEIAVESANDELLKELSSDDSTMMSALAKHVDVGRAQSEAIGITTVKTIKEDMDRRKGAQTWGKSGDPHGGPDVTVLGEQATNDRLSGGENQSGNHINGENAYHDPESNAQGQQVDDSGNNNQAAAGGNNYGDSGKESAVENEDF